MKSSLAQTNRFIVGFVIVLLAMLLLAGGWVVPFEYESFSILYKFGRDKVYLRSGKVIGITIFVLVFYQVVLASRFQVFQQAFSLKVLLLMHRLNGVVIAFLVIAHPLLIKASENFTPYTFQKKYYPEFLGIGVLAVLLALSVTALFRNLFKISYGKWLLLHRFGATLLIMLLPTHVLYVSETFKSGVPRDAAIIIVCLNFLMIMRIWLQRIFKKSR